MSEDDKAPNAREHRIAILHQRVGRLFEGKPADIVGLVLGQQIAAFFCAVSSDKEDARDGLDALVAGCRLVIDAHFADKPKPH